MLRKRKIKGIHFKLCKIPHVTGHSHCTGCGKCQHHPFG